MAVYTYYKASTHNSALSSSSCPQILEGNLARASYKTPLAVDGCISFDSLLRQYLDALHELLYFPLGVCRGDERG